MAAEASLARLNDLLRAVFGGRRFDSQEYLRWLYLANPCGRFISAEHEEQGRVLAHYSVIPQDYEKRGAVLRAALSLNTAVGEEVRGRGLFTSLAERAYEIARDKFGRNAILGVANANSTPGFCGRLRFKLLRPLPVVAGLRPPFVSISSVQSARAEEALSDGRLTTFSEGVTRQPHESWMQTSSPEWLHWRLSSPIGAYALHRSERALAVTTVAPHLGVKVAIILRVFAPEPLAAKESAMVVAAACKFHGAAVFVHAGINPHFQPAALAIPRRLLPSPLNLIYRPLDDRAPAADDFKLSQFELLDFDAY